MHDLPQTPARYSILLPFARGMLRQFHRVRDGFSSPHIRLQDLWYTEPLSLVSSSLCELKGYDLRRGFGDSRPNNKSHAPLHTMSHSAYGRILLSHLGSCIQVGHSTIEILRKISCVPLRNSTRSGLTIICAVRTADQLLVLSLVWEPSFQIIFDRGCIVEGARDDANDSVWQFEGFVELAGILDHEVEHSGGVFGVRNDKLE